MGEEPRIREPTLSTATRKLGRYELLTRIGQGGMAEVHLAMQRGPAGFEKLVVIKLVHEHLASQQAFVDMLFEEGRLAGMIKHPNVVDIYDLGDADGRYFVAMEYLDGEPLLAVLRRGVDGDRLDPLSTARVISDAAEGLEAAHRLKSHDGKPLGLVHHDVSLGNIVVLYSGVVKLVDFGVAKARRQGGDQSMAMADSRCGGCELFDTKTPLHIIMSRTTSASASYLLPVNYCAVSLLVNQI